MNPPRFVAVIDIGKTNAKVALVDLELRAELAVEKTPNVVLAGPPYPHFDIGRLFDFILDGLTKFAATHRVDAISITTHGATGALIAEDGTLALRILDYEHAGPNSLRADYESIRPPFAETGSPSLPKGLNLGAQLYWQAKTFPQEFERVRHILMYPQYWAFRLTGITASEATSLGCHTDLWNPLARTFSTLVTQSQLKTGVDWQPLFPPLRKASDILGPLKPELAELIGLPSPVPVHCGIHDSNASILPWLGLQEKSFAVVSTGTWVISMAIRGTRVALDPSRDTLINVNANGDPTPTARFMGGREFDRMVEGAKSATPSEVRTVLNERVMLFPSLEKGSGPFQKTTASWAAREPAAPGERYAAASFYCSLMTATCLELIGADGPIIVEGPFAANELYLGMLAAACGRPVATGAGSVTGTAIGAAMLANCAGRNPVPQPRRNSGSIYMGAFQEYLTLWRAKVAARPAS